MRAGDRDKPREKPGGAEQGDCDRVIPICWGIASDLHGQMNQSVPGPLGSFGPQARH